VRGCDWTAMRRLVRGRARSARQDMLSRPAGVGLRVAQSDLLILDRMANSKALIPKAQFVAVVNRRSD
jgi:hypothetical protein